MLLITVLLFTEYSFFKRQADLLLSLKQEYQDHILMYKKMLYEYQQLKEQALQNEDEKKKELTEQFVYQSEQDQEDADDDAAQEQDFVFEPVNREFNYLKESALAYARDNNLEHSVRTIYESEPPAYQLPPRRMRRQRAIRHVARPISGQLRKMREVYHKDFPCQLPLDRGAFWISSRFGPRRKKDGSPGFHFGLDMAAIKGTPVHAVAEGVVLESAHSVKGYGNCVVIKHDQKFKTRYAHLHKLYIKKGAKVARGQVIGSVGSTGFVRGKNGGKNASHLHFEVIEYDKHINPLYVL